MKKTRIIALFIFCLFALYSLFGFTILPTILKNQIIKNLDEKLTLRSEIEKVQFNPYTFEISLHNYKLINKNSEETSITLKKLYIDLAFFKSLFTRELNIQDGLLDELVLNIKEEKDGFDMEKILKNEDKKDDSKPIKFLVSQLNLSNSNINITNKKLQTIHLNEITLNIQNLGNETLSKNSLSFKINQNNNIDLVSNMKLNPLNLNGKVILKNLKIKELFDFKNDLFNFSINEEANINSDINFELEKSKQLDLKLSSNDFEFNNLSIKQKKSQLLSLKKLKLSRFDFDLNNSSLKTDGINIDGLNINFIKNKDKNNFQNLLKASNAKNTDENKKPFNTNIKSINIQNSTLSFEDKNLPLPFKTTVSKLEGEISEFSSNNANTSKLNLNGVVNTYGMANITGVINPNDIKFLTDVNLKFKNIEMKNLTPYSGKFLGRELKSGKLDLDLKYNIDKSNLEANNNIVITKLALGKQIKSKDAVSLPLEIAISLLEDSNGVINIDIPVSGNVDNPEFSISSIVWKSFSNLISKSITAPFTLLGKAFDFKDEELQTIKFDLNEEKITPIQKENLDKIAQILKVKKDLIIEITPSYQKDKEDENIAYNRVQNIKEYLLRNNKINKNQIKINNVTKNTTSFININIGIK